VAARTGEDAPSVSCLQVAVVSDADHIAAMAQLDDVNHRIVQFLQKRTV
jgi:hypothetical protein